MLGQQRIERVAKDGVGLAAADFHDAGGAFGDVRDFRGDGADGCGIGILGQMAHGEMEWWNGGMGEDGGGKMGGGGMVE